MRRKLARQTESARTLGAAVRSLVALDVLAQSLLGEHRLPAHAAQVLRRPGLSVPPQYVLLQRARRRKRSLALIAHVRALARVLAHVDRVVVLVARVAPADGAYDGCGAGGADAGLVLGALVDTQQSSV